MVEVKEKNDIPICGGSLNGSKLRRLNGWNFFWLSTSADYFLVCGLFLLWTRKDEVFWVKSENVLNLFNDLNACVSVIYT